MPRLSVKVKLLGLIALPFAASLALAGANVASHLAEMRLLGKLQRTTEFVVVLSDYVNAYQRERGSSSLFRSGGIDAATLAARRAELDETAGDLLPAAATLGLPEREGRILALSSGTLAELRAGVDSGKLDAAGIRGAYTAEISRLLSIAPVLARGDTSFGVGKVLNSIIILEDAKEAAGLLRANLSSIASRNAPVGSLGFRTVSDLEGRMKAGLSSPAIILDRSISERIAALSSHPGFRAAEEAYSAVLLGFERGGYGVDGARLFSDMTAFIDEIASLIGAAAQGLRSRIGDQVAADRAELGRLAAVFGGGFLVLAFLAVLVLGSLLRTIGALTRALASIAGGGGDLSARIAVESKDELGDLARHFNGFASSLAGIVDEVRSAAESLVDTGRELQAAMDETASTVERITAGAERARARAGDQSAGATESSAAVRSIGGRVAGLRDLIARQAAAVTSSSASIEEMVANVRSVTASVERMGGEYGGLLEAATEGRGLIDRVTAGIRDIEERSRKLESANALIAQVAAKTNLLAMNAAIEAAHAGDAGRGFAVVADEIRALAESVAEQSKSIKADVRGISTGIAEAARATESATGAFGGIQGRIEVVHALAAEIEAAMSEQSEGSSQILEALGAINGVTGEVREAAEEMAGASGAVVDEMDRLLAAALDIDRGMEEIATGVGEVSGAAATVADLGRRNAEGIGLVLERMGGFRTGAGPAPRPESPAGPSGA